MPADASSRKLPPADEFALAAAAAAKSESLVSALRVEGGAATAALVRVALTRVRAGTGGDALLDVSLRLLCRLVGPGNTPSHGAEEGGGAEEAISFIDSLAELMIEVVGSRQRVTASSRHLLRPSHHIPLIPYHPHHMPTPSHRSPSHPIST